MDIEEDFKGHLEIVYKSDNQCDKTETWGLHINIKCNQQLPENKYNILSVSNSTKCMPTVNLEYRCAKELLNFDRLNAIWFWIERYWFVATPLGIICGLFLFFT